MQNDNLEARKMFQRYDSVGRKFLLAVCSMTLPLANVFADYIDVNGEEYQALDYIAATGSQWMVTDIRPTCTDTVKMKFRLSALSKTQALYCSRTTMTTDTFTAFYIDNVVRCDRNTNTSTKGDTAPGVGDDTIFVADYFTRRFSVNGIEQDVLMADGDYAPGSALMLFASHKKGNDLSASIASGDVDNRATYRLYYYELYASGSQTPKHRLVPARRVFDHVVGLYDTIECKFYGPADNSKAFIASSSIRNVTAQQRYPWNGKVDISYTVIGDVAMEARQVAAFPLLKVSAIDMVANITNTATRLSGDLSLEDGTHAVVWDMDAEGLSFKSSNVVFKVECEMIPAAYCVVDLSSGSNASSYPVTYLAEPPSGGFNTDEYKTTKLVLKRIEAGSFVMGADQTEESHRVTLTQPFFCGIFEVTQKQYELVAGVNPCSSTSYGKGDTYPVHYMSYNMIRGASKGAEWPSSSDVDSTSFMGKLRARTRVDFDIPTEAQWEYACRSGTSTTYSYGDTANGDYMWYKGNSSSKSHPVGSKHANPWGLYDMHGNVWEFCLDWYGTLTYGNDPKGSSSGTQREDRGGSWFDGPDDCVSSYRGIIGPAWGDRMHGFRIVGPVSTGNGTICYNQSAITSIDLASGPRTTSQTERISYSSMWAAGADAVAVVEVNGEALNLANGSGCVDWTPMSNGVYVLTHKVVSGEEQVGETLAVTFLVKGLNPDAPVFRTASGTTFESWLIVAISCPTEGATIHYTIDGSEPTAESPVYRRFLISGKTTVKAIAEKNGLLSDVATAEYALGRCVDPVFSLADGASFAHSNQVVSIRWHYDGVLRYTIDGTDPTVESPIYEGPFAVSDSIELRAKVFSDDFFESSIVTSRLTRVWENVVTPQINAADSFTGSKRKVVISCATEGATVRYTLNGNEPNSHSTKYTGPFYVTGSCIVKAYAVMADYLDSAVATQEIVKVWGIGDAMGKPDHAFSTDGSGGAGWTRVADATAPNGEAMKSGAISHNQSSVLSTKVMGPGTLTFSWRTSCEEDELHEWDHAEFSVDGMVLLRRDGVNSWREESVRIEGDGEHAVAWTYTKDNVESEGEDAAWVAGYGWASDYVETKTTAVPVPYAWLLRHDPEIVDEFDAYESEAKMIGENGYKLWESYVIGANPNDRNDVLRITSFSMKDDGTLDLDSVIVSPLRSEWNVQNATLLLKGKVTLDDTDNWQPVTEENKAQFRFFKAEVVLP